MKISARITYASQAMFELALQFKSNQIQAKEIAERQQIPLKFLEQILIQLKRAGLLKSVRGAAGGYSLARRPEQITIKDVLEAVEGELNFVETRPQDPILDRLWSDLGDVVVGRLASVSLQDLVDERFRARRIPDFQI